MYAALLSFNSVRCCELSKAAVRCLSQCAAHGQHTLPLYSASLHNLKVQLGSPASALTHMHRSTTTPSTLLTPPALLTVLSRCSFRCLVDRRKWSDSACELCLWSAVLSVDGRQSVEFESSATFDRVTATEAQLMQAAAALGERVGQQLRANGAETILADIR